MRKVGLYIVIALLIIAIIAGVVFAIYRIGFYDAYGSDDEIIIEDNITDLTDTKDTTDTSTGDEVYVEEDTSTQKDTTNIEESVEGELEEDILDEDFEELEE